MARKMSPGAAANRKRAAERKRTKATPAASSRVGTKTASAMERTQASRARRGVPKAGFTTPEAKKTTSGRSASAYKGMGGKSKAMLGGKAKAKPTSAVKKVAKASPSKPARTVAEAQKKGASTFVNKAGKKLAAVTKEQLQAWEKKTGKKGLRAYLNANK